MSVRGVFIFKRKPLFSLPLCALSHSDSLVARLRHLWPPSTVWRCFLHLQKAAFFFIYHLKFKRAEMETHALSIRGTPGAVWGTSYRSICTKTACISDVPWKQRRLLITSTNSLRRTWREVENFKSYLFVHVYLLFKISVPILTCCPSLRQHQIYYDTKPFCNTLLPGVFAFSFRWGNICFKKQLFSKVKSCKPHMYISSALSCFWHKVATYFTVPQGKYSQK